jgi:hypothetical protein
MVDIVDGVASVQADDARLLSSHVSEAGLLTLHLDVFTSEGSMPVVIERKMLANGVWGSSAEAAQGLTQDPKPERLTVADSDMVPLILPESPSETPVLRHHHDGIWCSDISFGPDSAGSVQTTETIATSAVTNGVKVKVTYDSGAQTISGMGWNAGTTSSGFSATWSQSSTVTRSSGLTATYATITGATGSWSNREWRVTREYKKWYRHCPINGTTDWKTQRWIEPASVGGFPEIIVSRYSLPQCNTKWDLTGAVDIATENATAMTYLDAFSVGWGSSGGVSLSFKGSAQSGYTNKVKVKFTRPTTGYWYWCGNTFNPVESSKVRAGR